MQRSLYSKGQLSIEFLLIFAIFLVVLSLFLSQFLNMKDKTNDTLQKSLLTKYSNDLENTINSICILGNGNIRVLDLYLTEETNITSVQDYKIELISNSTSISINTKCKVIIFNNTISIKSGKIKIEGNEGRVLISPA